MGEIHFYQDEKLPVEVARQLRSRDVDVVTVRDLGLLGDMSSLSFRIHPVK